MSWDLLPTPNPNEFAVRVWADKMQIARALASMVAGTTTLKSLSMATAPTSEGFGDYVYVKCVGPNADGQLGLIFGKNKTAEELAQPFRTPVPTMRPFGWDEVLAFLKVDPDSVAQRSGAKVYGDGSGTFYAPEYYAQWGLVPGGEYLTRITRYEYFGPVPFNIPKHQGPVPTAVSVMMPGRETLHFGKVLHPRIKLERMITASAQVIAGTAQAAMSTIDGQVFPSTAPFEGWARQVIRDEQQELEVGWHRIKDVADPPPQPELTIDIQ